MIFYFPLNFSLRKMQKFYLISQCRNQVKFCFFYAVYAWSALNIYCHSLYAESLLKQSKIKTKHTMHFCFTQKKKKKKKKKILLNETTSSDLTLSWRRPLSYMNQFIGLKSKSMDCFLYDRGLLHERVKGV